MPITIFSAVSPQDTLDNLPELWKDSDIVLMERIINDGLEELEEVAAGLSVGVIKNVKVILFGATVGLQSGSLDLNKRIYSERSPYSKAQFDEVEQQVEVTQHSYLIGEPDDSFEQMRARLKLHSSMYRESDKSLANQLMAIRTRFPDKRILACMSSHRASYIANVLKKEKYDATIVGFPDPPSHISEGFHLYYEGKFPNDTLIARAVPELILYNYLREVLAENKNEAVAKSYNATKRMSIRDSRQLSRYTGRHSEGLLKSGAMMVMTSRLEDLGHIKI